MQVTKINGKIKIELSILERQDIYKDYQLQRKRSVDMLLNNKNSEREIETYISF